MWLFGTGKVDIGTSQDELWDKTRPLFGIVEGYNSIFKKVIIWKILRWKQHLSQDEKWPNYWDMVGQYLMPHKYHLALHFWWLNANDEDFIPDANILIPLETIANVNSKSNDVSSDSIMNATVLLPFWGDEVNKDKLPCFACVAVNYSSKIRGFFVISIIC
jgi:hypothetical protein